MVYVLLFSKAFNLFSNSGSKIAKFGKCLGIFRIKFVVKMTTNFFGILTIIVVNIGRFRTIWENIRKKGPKHIKNVIEKKEKVLDIQGLFTDFRFPRKFSVFIFWFLWYEQLFRVMHVGSTILHDVLYRSELLRFLQHVVYAMGMYVQRPLR